MNSIADLPKLIEDLVASFIGFLYRTSSTFFMVVRSPLHGSVRAYVSPNGLRPLTALFLGAALVAFSSILVPDHASGVLRQEKRDIVSWLLFSVAMLLVVDLIINLGSWVAWPRGRRRRRGKDVLRLAASAMLVMWFAQAMYVRWESGTLWAVGGVSARPGPRPDWVAALLFAVPLVPVLGSAITLYRSRSSRHRRPLLLPLGLLLVIAGMVVKSETSFAYYLEMLDYRLRWAAEPENKMEPLPQAEAQTIAVKCSVGREGRGVFDGALANPSSRTMVVSSDVATVGFLPADHKISNLRFETFPVRLEGPRVMILPAGAAIPIRGTFQIPDVATVKVDDWCGVTGLKSEGIGSPEG